MRLRLYMIISPTVACFIMKEKLKALASERGSSSFKISSKGQLSPLTTSTTSLADLKHQLSGHCRDEDYLLGKGQLVSKAAT